MGGGYVKLSRGPARSLTPKLSGVLSGRSCPLLFRVNSPPPPGQFSGGRWEAIRGSCPTEVVTRSCPVSVSNRSCQVTTSRGGGVGGNLEEVEIKSEEVPGIQTYAETLTHAQVHAQVRVKAQFVHLQPLVSAGDRTFGLCEEMPFWGFKMIPI